MARRTPLVQRLESLAGHEYAPLLQRLNELVYAYCDGPPKRSLAALARAVSYDPSTLSKYLAGAAEVGVMPAESLARLCRAMDLDDVMRAELFRLGPYDAHVTITTTELVSVEAIDRWHKTERAAQETRQDAAQKEYLRALLHDHSGFLNNRLASFVGREEELTTIWRHIADLLPTGGYLTIIGRAGQGKSSVIAALVEALGRFGSLDQMAYETVGGTRGRVARHEPLALAYHFIPLVPGSDHQVGLLRNLLARLTLKYDLSGIYTSSESRFVLRDYFAQALRDIADCGGHEIIFIDGLDQIEADASGVRDLSFLPESPPEGVVFVLGARPDDTLVPLELKKRRITFWLPDLNRIDFDLVLLHHGVTLDSHMADRFYAVMQQNALYLDLVARELREAGLDTPPEALISRIADDPDNLFSLAIERFQRNEAQWERVLKPILGVLFVARQALSLRALRVLINQANDATQRGLRRLGGLVASDGAGRYSLYHLKLIDFMREDPARTEKKHVFAADEEHVWHATMVRWCKGSDDLRAIWHGAPGDVLEQERRSYARQHYVAHLAAARAYDQLWAVIDAGEYGRAKLLYDPSAHSYALDLDIARQAVLDVTQGECEAQMHLLPRLWKYSLLRCSLSSQVDMYPDSLYIALVLVEQEQQAIGMVELLNDRGRRARLLARIGETMVMRLRHVDDGQQLVSRAMEIAQSIEDDDTRSQSLKTVAVAMARAGRGELALTTMQFISDEEVRYDALNEVIRALVESGQAKKAIEFGHTVDAIMSRALLLASVAEGLARTGQSEQAVELAQSIIPVSVRVSALVDVASTLIRVGLERQAIETVRTITDAKFRSKALGKVAQVLAETGHQADALSLCADAVALARSFTGKGQRAEALATSAIALARTGNVEEALALCSEADQLMPRSMSPWQKDTGLELIAEAFAWASQVERALATASTVPGYHSRSATFGVIAVALAHVGHEEQALVAAYRMEDGQERDEILQSVARVFAGAGKITQAIAIAQAFPSSLSERTLWPLACTLRWPAQQHTCAILYRYNPLFGSSVRGLRPSAFPTERPNTARLLANG